MSVILPNLDHFLDLHSVSSEQFIALLHLARRLKQERHTKGHNQPILADKSLAMIFEKPSLRTRVSFEMGMQHFGGHALYLSPQEVGMGTRESVPDIARVLSGYVDGIMARVFKHGDVIQLARWATVPVINGLSDFSHPCQAIADIFTIWEAANYPPLSELMGKTLVYIGDGSNNVATSLLQAAGKVGMQVNIVSPKEYQPNPDVLANTDADVNVTDDLDGVVGADFIYTDVWTSMGQETERAQRSAALSSFQINEDLIQRSRNQHVQVMHCLPAHRGEEITDEVADSEHSLLFPQAHNRLHAQKALLAHLIGKVPLEKPE
ncbi:MAG: ornithine carbamoyltransferase [Caldilineaceae bacterium]